MKYVVSTTDEYSMLVDMFMRYDLEFSVEEPLPTELIRCWKAEDEKGGLIGGCVLAARGGEYIIDGIATVPEHRDKRIASRLMKLAADEVKARKGNKIYLVAKVPGFFKKLGFDAIDFEDVPLLFDCRSCPQFQKTCFPNVMMLTL